MDYLVSLIRAARNLGAISAIAFAAAIPTAHAATFTYSLNGSFAEDSNSGPSLVSHGGTLGPTGYSFGPNTGLSLSDAVTADGPYSIDISFYFDAFSGVTNTGYQRILDFRNRLSDSGLYEVDGGVRLFASSYAPGLPPAGPSLSDPQAASAPHALSEGTTADLLVTRDASGLFSAYVNGLLAFSVLDTVGATKFSGPDNIIWFFVDDLQSLFFYPDTPEAGSGFIDSITVTSDVAPVPLPATLPLFTSGLGVMGWLARRRKQLRPRGLR